MYLKSSMIEAKWLQRSIKARTVYCTEQILLEDCHKQTSWQRLKFERSFLLNLFVRGSLQSNFVISKFSALIQLAVLKITLRRLTGTSYRRCWINSTVMSMHTVLQVCWSPSRRSCGGIQCGLTAVPPTMGFQTENTPGPSSYHYSVMQGKIVFK